MVKKAALVLLTSSVVIAAPIAAQRSSPIAGTWDVHIVFQSGRTPLDEAWVITQDGSKVTGKVVIRNISLPIEGSLDGNSRDGYSLNIKVTTRPAGAEAGERYHYFIGPVTGDSITGTLERVDNTDEATFTAKRK